MPGSRRRASGTTRGPSRYFIPDTDAIDVPGSPDTRSAPGGELTTGARPESQADPPTVTREDREQNRWRAARNRVRIAWPPHRSTISSVRRHSGCYDDCWKGSHAAADDQLAAQDAHGEGHRVLALWGLGGRFPRRPCDAGPRGRRCRRLARRPRPHNGAAQGAGVGPCAGPGRGWLHRLRTPEHPTRARLPRVRCRRALYATRAGPVIGRPDPSVTPRQSWTGCGLASSV